MYLERDVSQFLWISSYFNFLTIIPTLNAVLLHLISVLTPEQSIKYLQAKGCKHANFILYCSPLKSFVFMPGFGYAPVLHSSLLFYHVVTLLSESVNLSLKKGSLLFSIINKIKGHNVIFTVLFLYLINVITTLIIMIHLQYCTILDHFEPPIIHRK